MKKDREMKKRTPKARSTQVEVNAVQCIKKVSSEEKHSFQHEYGIQRAVWCDCMHHSLRAGDLRWSQVRGQHWWFTSINLSLHSLSKPQPFQNKDLWRRLDQPLQMNTEVKYFKYVKIPSICGCLRHKDWMNSALLYTPHLLTSEADYWLKLGQIHLRGTYKPAQ